LLRERGSEGDGDDFGVFQVDPSSLHLDVEVREWVIAAETSNVVVRVDAFLVREGVELAGALWCCSLTGGDGGGRHVVHQRGYGLRASPVHGRGGGGGLAMLVPLQLGVGGSEVFLVYGGVLPFRRALWGQRGGSRREQEATLVVGVGQMLDRMSRGGLVWGGGADVGILFHWGLGTHRWG
jgi:hypothetical protein